MTRTVEDIFQHKAQKDVALTPAESLMAVELIAAESTTAESTTADTVAEWTVAELTETGLRSAELTTAELTTAELTASTTRWHNTLPAKLIETQAMPYSAECQDLAPHPTHFTVAADTALITWHTVI